MERMYVIFLFMFLYNAICSSSSSPSNTTLCSADECFALLHFKNSFSITKTELACPYDVSYPKTKSWKKGSDCCSWDGVTCDRLTGQVIGLDLSCSGLLGALYPNSTLFDLHHLRKLNLAYNNFMSEISSKFGHFTELTVLNLTSSHFYGPVPPEISYLSKLVSLDLSTMFYTDLTLDQHSFDRLSQNLTKLKYLDLSVVNMSLVAPGSLVNLSSSLISLTLSRTELQGKFPNDVLHFPFLQQLALSQNGPFIGHLPKSNWSSPLKILDFSQTLVYGDAIGDPMDLPDAIGDLIHLNVLELSSCAFKGPIPKSLSNLTRLTFLSLRENEFSGLLPSSIFNLTQLSSIDLSDNQLEGHFPSQVRGLPHITALYLSDNLLSGKIPSSLLALPSLQFLYLYSNKLTGPIDPIQRPGSVQEVDFSNNEIHGSIPDSMFELVNLSVLNLSSNNLNGTVNSTLFSKLINLVSINLSYNRLLSLKPYSNFNFTLPNLSQFFFSSCNITEFPAFLRNSRNLNDLDLSDNRISGRISLEESELWQGLNELNLSNNFLTSVVQIPSMDLTVLDLHSNLLQGPLSALLPSANVDFFSVSNNKLTGEIPSSICNMSRIISLILSNNSFSGKIPECLLHYGGLTVLDLSMNNFHGSIPEMSVNGCSLVTIDLNGNELEGPLPASLANCSILEVLDIGNNMINDKFPDWLATLPELQVLILRSNKFHGNVGNSKARFPFLRLRILDVAHNGFTGLLPTNLLKSFKSMTHSDNDSAVLEYMGGYYYEDSVVLSWKGSEVQFKRILTVLSVIDLSSNQFQGEIPEVVGKLNSLKVLNLSHNRLTGQIPSSLRNLTQLESLDLSSNKLIGKIPTELTSLTFLSVLNLSYNRLVGTIPQGKQFNTFQSNSYVGNLGLCGPPLLSKKCVNDEAPESVQSIFIEEEGTCSWLDWKVISMGYGSGLVMGLSMGYIVFSKGRPHWFVKRFDRQARKVSRISRSHQRRNQ